MCLCVVVCVYLSPSYLTLTISTVAIVRMAAQFFSLAYSFYFGQSCTHFYFTYFVNFIQVWGTNRVVVVVGKQSGFFSGSMATVNCPRVWMEKKLK